MTNTWNYSRELNPPFPVLPVRLFKPWSTSRTLITENLQVDSGADMTAVPLSIIEKLRPRLLVMGEAYDFDGNLVDDVPIYELGIEIIGIRFDSVRVYGLSSDIGFIGRDLLNNFHVSLDGPGRLLTFS